MHCDIRAAFSQRTCTEEAFQVSGSRCCCLDSPTSHSADRSAFFKIIQYDHTSDNEEEEKAVCSVDHIHEHNFKFITKHRKTFWQNTY